jgi:hypothetical protein
MLGAVTKGRARRVALWAIAIALYFGCAKGASTFDGKPASGSDPVETTCGNGVIDATEECDGVNLHEESCESLGMGEGMLSCDPVTCSYDTSMCAGPPSGGSGGGGTRG